MFKTKRLLIAFGAIVFASSGFASVSAANTTNTMTKQQADTLLSSGKFHGVKSIKDIPKLWWKTMALEGMSDIGGPFSAGCTGQEPHRRLIAAAISEPYAILVSEQGGIAYMTEVRVFKHEKDAVTQVYEESVREPRLKEVTKKLAP